MDPMEDESASADRDDEEKSDYDELPSLESCNSDSKCESKNNHKGRHEEEDQDLRPIVKGYNGTEIWDEDEILIFPTFFQTSKTGSTEDNFTFTMYKRADKKIHPVSGTFPEEARVHRTIPENPLLTLQPLPIHPPSFIPGNRLTEERLLQLEVNKDEFLWAEEEKLFQHIMLLNEEALAFEDKDRGILKESYFSDYIMPTVPHTPWEFKNIPIPPGIRVKVIELLKAKVETGVYEASESSYRCRWFCVLKKNGKLRIIHDLQLLNKVSIRDAGLLPILDDCKGTSVRFLTSPIFSHSPPVHMYSLSSPLYHFQGPYL
jgi:hypothetical protein